MPVQEITHGGNNGVPISNDDATWILTSAFIVFTMQSGFGLLESGSVSMRNEVNIMVKNAVDVIFGGLTYWMFGYGLSFGEMEPYVNKFCGWGDFFVSSQDTEEKLGWVYSKFFFQASFATTATTIVSGGMAERTKLESYIIFSFFNTFVFCFPAHWMWGTKGWLMEMGAVDIAGAGPVHLVGGVTAFVATVILKPRHGRYKFRDHPEMGSPTNAILGMFMLWWGWLGFNCGSTFGISGQKWKLAARSAVSTLCASMGGGFMGIVLSYIVKRRKFDVTYMINGVLGSLVGITAFCALAQPWEGIVIGAVGGLITNGSVELLNRLKVDDPVGCVGTHAFSGIWSLLAVGLFARKDMLGEALSLNTNRAGLFQGGGFYLLGVQALAVASLTGWTLITSFIILKLIDITIGLRIPLREELLGADIVEHGIGEEWYDKITKTVSQRERNSVMRESNAGMFAARRMRRKSLGKRSSWTADSFIQEDTDGEAQTVEREEVDMYSGGKPPSVYSSRTESRICSCCFSWRPGRRRQSMSPEPYITPNGSLRRCGSRVPGESDDLPRNGCDLQRTEYIQRKYSGENGTTKGYIRNGYANGGYGLSRDPSTEFPTSHQIATVINEHDINLTDLRDHQITYM